MHSSEQLQWVKRPRQQRSQQTLERILQAAEERIAEVGFEGATIADIVKLADSSVGSFYTRFKDKDALLRCLLDRFVDEVGVTIDSSLRAELWTDVDFENVCQRLVHFMMRMMRQRALLLAAISRVTMQDPELGAFRAQLTEHTVVGLRTLLAARGERITCANPDDALRVVSWMCINLFEASVVHPANHPVDMTPEECEAELCNMILSYLRIESQNLNGESK
jgi:AcrR family transcriptional regulator